MRIRTLSSIGLEGLRHAAASAFEHSQALVDSFSKPDGDPLEAIIGLKQDQHAFRASAAIVKTDQELSGSLLDILA